MHDKDGSLQISERINDFLIKGSLMVVSEPNLEEVPENVEFISFLSLIVEELIECSTDFRSIFIKMQV
jgi:hypothetical protein